MPEIVIASTSAAGATTTASAAEPRARRVGTAVMPLLWSYLQRVYSRDAFIDFLTLFLEPVIDLNFFLLVVARLLHFFFALRQEGLAQTADNLRLLLLDSFLQLCFVVGRGSPQSCLELVRKLHH